MHEFEPSAHPVFSVDILDVIFNGTGGYKKLFRNGLAALSRTHQGNDLGFPLADIELKFELGSDFRRRRRSGWRNDLLCRGRQGRWTCFLGVGRLQLWNRPAGIY